MCTIRFTRHFRKPPVLAAVLALALAVCGSTEPAAAAGDGPDSARHGHPQRLDAAGPSRSVIRTLGQVDHLHQRTRGPLPAGEAGEVVAAARAAMVEEIAPPTGGGLSGDEKPGKTAKGKVAGSNGLGQTLVSRECDAAEKGDAAAAYRLGRRYLFGMGVVRDKRMGVAWMRAAASRGYGPAFQVAQLVPRNWGRMRPWCRLGTGPVRTVTPPPAEIVRLVEALAPGFGLDPHLVLAVIQVESAYRTNAVSPKEAAGLMQLIPDTAARFGVRNVFDPEENIRGGMKYLRWLLSYFRGDLTLALAGYNAGEGAVDRHGGVPPYAETRAYVRLVHRLYPQTRHTFDPAVSSASARAVRQTADAGAH